MRIKLDNITAYLEPDDPKLGLYGFEERGKGEE